MAIKGHPTRGKEVIELLEMLGGDNSDTQCRGIEVDFYYYIDTYGCINYEDCFIVDEAELFTLEEFLERFPYKVRDFVRIPEYESELCILKMKWCPVSEHIEYLVCPNDDEEWFTADELLEYNDNPIKTRDCKKCGLHFGSVRCFDKDCPHNTPKNISDLNLKHKNLEETQSNQDIDKDVFRKEFCECCGSQRCSGQDDELEYCERFKNIMDNSGTPFVEKHKMEEIKSKREYDELRMPLDDDDKLATEVTIMGKRILAPDGFLVGKITQTDNGMLVEYVNKKPKYPKTIEECVKLLGVDFRLDMDSYKRKLIANFYRLILCRDAYWKIAGEQMGLDKPWKPDWTDNYQKKFTICYYQGEISLTNGPNVHRILAFPTEEIRDTFYENFKDLIERCKELL